MARPERLELSVSWSEARRFIQLSYGRSFSFFIQLVFYWFFVIPYKKFFVKIILRKNEYYIKIINTS